MLKAQETNSSTAAPQASLNDAAPAIHGPKVFGVRPGSPFLYTIPATGERPIAFAAENLPPGLALDAATGRITGTLPDKGEHLVTLKATNAKGTATRPFRIVVGDAIALTPPMGWNSWNCFGGSVTQEEVEHAAQAFVDKGLRDHGWTYINIDDGWQGVRGGPLKAIQPNSKFPDMKALAAKIHDLGLRFGIYSTPWRGSYEGHIGGSCDDPSGVYPWITSGDHNEFYRISSDPAAWDAKRRTNYKFGRYSFVDKDAAQWAEWQIDYLKYDWSPMDVKSTATIADALRATGRDVVLSLSNRAPFKSATDWARLANSWRTTGDIRDTWQSMSSIGFQQAAWAPFAGPGHWNDPDMLIVGNVGWGHPKPTHLTHDEQYTHMSLWCLLSAPLLIGCDLNALDDFTLKLLTNDELLDIDQDSLGREAVPLPNTGVNAVYVKALDDGSVAVGLFNTQTTPQTVSVKASDLGVRGPHKVRDLWQKKDLGELGDTLSATIPPHGVVLCRISPL